MERLVGGFEHFLHPAEYVDWVAGGLGLAKTILRVVNMVIHVLGDSVLHHSGQKLVLYAEQ